MKAIEAANNLHQSEPNMGLSFLSENRYLLCYTFTPILLQNTEIQAYTHIKNNKQYLFIHWRLDCLQLPKLAQKNSAGYIRSVYAI